MRKDLLTEEQAKQFLSDRIWRLNHLYTIKTKDRKLQPLRLNRAQLEYLANESDRDIICKARQLGFSTLKLIEQLDSVLWSKNTNAAVIAHRKEKVQVLFEIVKLAYEHFPSFGAFYPKPKASYDNRNELYFPELNSKIYVAIDTRGETVHNLHVSEIAYIERAEEKMLGILESVPKNGVISFESTGNGTCYDNKTEVLTNNGWKLFSELKDEDSILTMNPQTNRAYFEKKWKFIKERFVGEMIGFKSQKLDLLVSPNHLIFLKKRKKWEFVNAEKLLNKKIEIRLRKTFDICGKRRKFFVLPRYSYNRGNGISYKKEIKIKIEEWLEFLGYFLSEGCVIWKHGTKQVVISQKKFYEKMKKSAERVAKYLGGNVYCNGDKIVIPSAQLTNYLRKYTQPKRIPRKILELDKTLLKIFADAFYLGDGDIKRNSGYGRVFAGKDTELSDSLQEMYLRMGYSSSVFRRNGKNQIVTFSKKDITLFETNKGIRKESYNGFIYCVNLPKYHLLMIRRNGKAVWCGNSGYFYQTWEDPRSEFRKHFYSWTVDPDYQEYTSKTLDSLIAEYRPLQIQYNLIPEIWEKLNLTREQFSWYIGKVRRHKEKVMQEYPSNPMEAFVASGRNIFSMSDLQKHPIKDPIDRKYQDLLIWEQPQHNFMYVIGCDPSEGIGEDNAAIEVLNAYTGEQVAELAVSNIPPDELAGYLIDIGRFYNKAYIVLEINNHGISVRDHLKRKYSNLYRREVYDKASNKYTEMIGWKTTGVTKPLLVDLLEEATRNQDILIHSEKALSEMKTFVRTDEEGKRGFGAESPNKDDRVIALGLALQGIRHLPKMKAPKSIAQKRLEEFIKRQSLSKYFPQETVIHGHQKRRYKIRGH